MPMIVSVIMHESSLWKRKKDIENTIDFHQILDESCRKSNKAWVDKSNGFCNTSMK